VKFLATNLPGVVIVEPEVHRDNRGYFFESYHQKKFKDAGLPLDFVQDNISKSVQNTLRGLHAQIRQPQGKLIGVIEGEVFDVAVDIRKNSPTFGKWTSALLSADNFKRMYVPPGFAHGFCVVSRTAVVEYKCTDFYDPADEVTILWNDPGLAISWPVKNPILSGKDARGEKLSDLIEL